LGVTPAAPIVGATSFGPGHPGYWLVGADGGVFAFGACTPFFGSMAGRHLDAPIVGITSAQRSTGWGYWLVGADGGVFAFGHVGFYGSASNLHLNAPIVGMVATPDGEGYWLVGRDGGVFAFGDARFEGSAVGETAANVVGIAIMAGETPDAPGYWLTTSEGAVYAFGSADNEGSASNLSLSAPIVAIVASQGVPSCSPSPGNSTQGYWLVGRDGGVFAYGSAPFEGSEAGKPLAAPIEGAEADGLEIPLSCPAMTTG
jgi:hypothetical protein